MPKINLNLMHKAKLIILLILSVFLTACGSMQIENIDPMNYNQLLELKYTPRGNIPFSEKNNQLRTKGLKDTAMCLAAQGGLAWASQAINKQLEKDKWHLETIYNFNGMMLSHGVIPPVLVQGDNSLNLADPNTIRVADKTYKIIQQARFATTPPNWRGYLWMTYPTPEIPNRSLLPRNREEIKIWRKGISIGWEKGIQQAFNNFQQNLARLKRDYQGMILYRKLLQEKMISAPFVMRTELGVTGNGTDMRINDQVLRITELPQLQTESQTWHPIVVRNDN